MASQYEKSWSDLRSRERNAKIRRLRSEDEISFLCKRFGLSWEQVEKNCEGVERWIKRIENENQKKPGWKRKVVKQLTLAYRYTENR